MFIFEFKFLFLFYVLNQSNSSLFRQICNKIRIWQFFISRKNVIIE